MPFLGDAELIVGPAPTGEDEQGRARVTPDHMGSIDAAAVLKLVEKILPGGRDAFERQQDYGF